MKTKLDLAFEKTKEKMLEVGIPIARDYVCGNFGGCQLRFGWCNFRKKEIGINPLLLEDGVDARLLEKIIAHELIHTIEDGIGHDDTFIYWSKIANENLGINITIYNGNSEWMMVGDTAIRNGNLWMEPGVCFAWSPCNRKVFQILRKKSKFHGGRTTNEGYTILPPFMCPYCGHYHVVNLVDRNRLRIVLNKNLKLDLRKQFSMIY